MLYLACDHFGNLVTQKLLDVGSEDITIITIIIIMIYKIHNYIIITIIWSILILYTITIHIYIYIYIYT